MLAFKKCLHVLSLEHFCEEDKIRGFFLLVARIWLSAFFVYSGIGKILNYSQTAHFMSSNHVPVAFLPLVILLEAGGGLSIMFGFLTKPISLALMLFAIITVNTFHVSGYLLYAELSWAGGFLLLATVGAGRYSLDRLLATSKT